MTTRSTWADEIGVRVRHPNRVDPKIPTIHRPGWLRAMLYRRNSS